MISSSLASLLSSALSCARLALALSCAALVPLGISGCDGGDDDNGTDGGGGTGGGGAGGGGGTGGGGASTCSSLATEYCRKIDECLPFFTQVLFGDVGACAERVKLGCDNDLAAPGSGLSTGNISGCVNAVRGASCGDLLNRKVTACEFKGTRANGAACGSGSQCVSGYCKISGSTQCGTCSAQAAEGGFCDTDDEECQAGLVCNLGGVCTAPGAAGAPCDEDRPCAFELYCRIETGTVGTCAAQLGAGAACMDSDSCNLGRGLFCNAGASRCQAIGVASAGNACGAVNGGFVVCSNGGTCQVSGLNDTGVCSATAGDGQACGTAASDMACRGPAQCISSTCRIPDARTCN